MTEKDFDSRVRALEEKMYRIARSMLRSDFDCADAIQNAVFAAWRRLSTLREEERFESWLMRILINACRDCQRGYQKRKGEGPLEDTLIESAQGIKNLDLQMALQRLPEKYRLPVLLHHMNGLSVPQISRILILPQTTVKGRIREGLKRLRTMLEEDEE
ncbi:MAG: sigma-70 family RNA polymerase sigma factor [Clostridiales bacterium]|nr:sigma-70 family RNA polymerase sigma factor [Clostridiales bacterium]